MLSTNPANEMATTDNERKDTEKCEKQAKRSTDGNGEKAELLWLYLPNE
jgi:hypothetical protein